MTTRHPPVAAPLTAWIALLSPACAEVPAVPTGAAVQAVAAVPMVGPGPRAPSQLDYLVLASFADAPNLMAMSTHPASAH